VAFLAYLVSFVVFVLIVFGVDFDSVSQLELMAVGLAFFVLGHILPGGDPRGYFNKS
jgi:hypothetical protein